jgi:hypothetical protein
MHDRDLVLETRGSQNRVPEAAALPLETISVMLPLAPWGSAWARHNGQKIEKDLLYRRCKNGCEKFYCLLHTYTLASETPLR